MNLIDIDKHLFEKLESDYENAKNDIEKINYGFDYIEAIVKFFGSVNISILRYIEKETFQDILLKNFKLSPSLGDYKSLATLPFSKDNYKRLKDKKTNIKDIYEKLYNLFTRKDKI
jgi:hypothetical protein